MVHRSSPTARSASASSVALKPPITADCVKFKFELSFYRMYFK